MSIYRNICYVNQLVSLYAAKIVGSITIAGDAAGVISGVLTATHLRTTASTFGVIGGLIMFIYGTRTPKKEQSDQPNTVEPAPQLLALPQSENVVQRILNFRKNPIESSSAMGLVAGGIFFASGMANSNVTEAIKGGVICAALLIMIFGKEHGNKLPEEADWVSKSLNYLSRSPVQSGSILFKGVTASSLIDGFLRGDKAMIASGLLFLVKDLTQFFYIKKNDMGNER